MNSLFNAYQQAPWRTQRQMIGYFLAAIVVLTMIAAIYLDVTARTAILGREVQRLEAEIETNRRINAELETRIAEALSTEETDRRSREMGFRPVQPDQLEYLPVPGYVCPSGIALAESPNPRLNALSVPMDYNQSLLEWLEQHLQGPGSYGDAR